MTRPPQFVEALSRRELDVVRYLPSRMTNQEIASELYVSLNTVKTHLKRIYRKLNVKSRDEAVVRCRELRLLSPLFTIDTVPDPVFVFQVEEGPRFRCVAVNPAGLTATGFSKDAVLGKLLNEIVPPKEAVLSFERFKAAMEVDEPIRSERTIDLPAGQLSFEITTTVVRGEGGSGIHIVTLSRDVTDLQKVQVDGHNPPQQPGDEPTCRRRAADWSHRIHRTGERSPEGEGLARVGKALRLPSSTTPKEVT